MILVDTSCDEAPPLVDKSTDSGSVNSNGGCFSRKVESGSGGSTTLTPTPSADVKSVHQQLILG